MYGLSRLFHLFWAEPIKFATVKDFERKQHSQLQAEYRRTDMEYLRITEG